MGTPDWVLDEPTDVTLVSETDDGIFLVTRTVAPGAILLALTSDGRVLVNGVHTDPGEDLMAYCEMIDEYYEIDDPARWKPASASLGITRRIEPAPRRIETAPDHYYEE